MPNTFIKISTVTVGASGSSSIEFTSIPQTYTDLQLVLSARSTQAAEGGMYIDINGSSSNFTGRYLFADGSSASSGSLARYVGTILGTNYTASVFNNTEIYFPNYTSSNYKSFSVNNVAENNGTYCGLNFINGLWSITSAITSIKINPPGGNMAQYSTATLYGITKA